MSWLPHFFKGDQQDIYFVLSSLTHDLSILNEFQFIISSCYFLMITFYPLWWGNFILWFLAAGVSAYNMTLLSGVLKCSVCSVCLLVPGLESATRREGNNMKNEKNSSLLTFY